MRRRFVQINGTLYERGTEPQVEGPMVMGDIAPYKSMIDGSEITSRGMHRAHLRAHGCVEIGNEAIKQMDYYSKLPKVVAPQQLHESIRAQISPMRHAEFKAAIKRDVDRVKWNSRED